MHPLLHEDSIEVRDGRFGKCVHARRAIAPGEVVLVCRGVPQPGRTRHTFQVDHDLHVEFPGPVELINHACEPNCGVLLRPEELRVEIHALRPIAPGEELFTDYRTFELDISFFDRCSCGTPACGGRITGFRDLTDEQRMAYGPYLAPYLRAGELVEAV